MPGCWQDASVPFSMAFSKEFSWSSITLWQPASLRTSDPKRECAQDGNRGIFYNLISAMTCYHFFHTQTNLDTIAGRLCKNTNTRTGEALGVSLEAGSHTLRPFHIDSCKQIHILYNNCNCVRNSIDLTSPQLGGI